MVYDLELTGKIEKLKREAAFHKTDIEFLFNRINQVKNAMGLCTVVEGIWYSFSNSISLPAFASLNHLKF